MSSLLLINVVRFVFVLFVDVSKKARVEMFMLEAVSETSSRITLSLYSNTMSDTLWFWTEQRWVLSPSWGIFCLCA
jgi:hypothetical protein